MKSEREIEKRNLESASKHNDKGRDESCVEPAAVDLANRSDVTVLGFEKVTVTGGFSLLLFLNSN